MRWHDIELGSAATVDDFVVEVREMEDLGGIVHLVSASRGELAWFPAWEHAERDLRHFVASDVPLGTLDDPYEDCDEGWRLVVFEEGGYIYVFEDDSPRGERFPRRFRIPRERYLAAWAILIHHYNPLIGLDELFSEGAG